MELKEARIRLINLLAKARCSSRSILTSCFLQRRENFCQYISTFYLTLLEVEQPQSKQLYPRVNPYLRFTNFSASFSLKLLICALCFGKAFYASSAYKHFWEKFQAEDLNDGAIFIEKVECFQSRTQEIFF